MASAQVLETSVTNNSPSQDSNHPDDLFQSKYVTPGFKPNVQELLVQTPREVMQSLCHPLSSWNPWPSNILQNVAAISSSSQKGCPEGLALAVV